MILAIDVDYREDEACVAGVCFSQWQDNAAEKVISSKVTGVEDYVAGQFYKRELPCILALISEHQLAPDLVIVDGFVFLDGVAQAGLGFYLYQALDQKIPVIGVAKHAFKGISSDYALCRGQSKNPLYVTCVGIEQAHAIDNIHTMAGDYRIPTLLKKADQACRAWHVA